MAYLHEEHEHLSCAELREMGADIETHLDPFGSIETRYRLGGQLVRIVTTTLHDDDDDNQHWTN